MNEVERDAQKNILFNWNKLSLGDISVIQAALDKRGSHVVTMPDTAHNYFWRQMVRLGWAADGEELKALEALPIQPETFCLTDRGMELLPKFVAYRDLFQLTIWNNTPRDQRSPEPPRGHAHLTTPPPTGSPLPDPIVRDAPSSKSRSILDVVRRTMAARWHR